MTTACVTKPVQEPESSPARRPLNERCRMWWLPLNSRDFRAEVPALNGPKRNADKPLCQEAKYQPWCGTPVSRAMTERQETVAEVLEWMKNAGDGKASLLLRGVALRIEVALKREREEVEKVANDLEWTAQTDAAELLKINQHLAARLRRIVGEK